MAMKLRLSIVLALGGLAFAAGEASACLNGIEIEVNPKVAALQGAEAALRVRDYRVAGQLAMTALPRWRTVAPGKSNLEQRAVRIFAIVITRTAGAWHERGYLSDPTAKLQNLKTALRWLRLRAISQPTDAGRVTDLGEALEKLGEVDEARHVLETLAKSTSITSAEGWAALARLRANAGDDAGRRHAETMCRSMTSKDELCLTPSSA
jgi:hypothetical protein